jgi:putative nucleotidyltransferase with HDIG domain
VPAPEVEVPQRRGADEGAVRAALDGPAHDARLPPVDVVERGQILASFGLPDGVVRHSEGVRRVASEAARLVGEAGIELDQRLVASAALLHDIDKLETRQQPGEHGLRGAVLLERLGHPELAMPVACHPVACLLDDDRFPRGWPSVLVAVADRHVAQCFMSIEERLADMAQRHPEHRVSILATRRPAEALELQVAEAAGLEPAELVERLRTAWAAGA